MTTKASDAVKDAKEQAKEDEKAREEAVEEEQTRTEIDAAFHEDVAKASEKRNKALAKLDKKAGRGGNIAEIAWNETKAEEDPVYASTAFDHRNKLNAAVDAIRTSGNADIVGLEAFEARVVELLKEEKEAVGTPTRVAADAKANASAGK